MKKRWSAVMLAGFLIGAMPPRAAAFPAEDFSAVTVSEEAASDGSFLRVDRVTVSDPTEMRTDIFGDAVSRGNATVDDPSLWIVDLPEAMYSAKLLSPGGVLSMRSMKIDDEEIVVVDEAGGDDDGADGEIEYIRVPQHRSWIVCPSMSVVGPRIDVSSPLIRIPSRIRAPRIRILYRKERRYLVSPVPLRTGNPYRPVYIRRRSPPRPGPFIRHRHAPPPRRPMLPPRRPMPMPRRPMPPRRHHPGRK